MSLTETAGPFNATNNVSDGYKTNCTDRWEHIKAPLHGRRRYQRKTLTSQSQSHRLESKATYIKPPTLPTKGTNIIDTLKGYWLPFLLFCFILQYTFSFWLWHWRRCGRHHIGDHPHRSSLLIHTGIQARIWTRLDTFHSTDEVMLHQARFILKSLVIKKILYRLS